MAVWNTEEEARGQIKELVSDYYHQFKENRKEFEPGDRVNYSGRCFDEKEMQTLTDAMLDFWLTSGHYADQFEQRMAKLLGVKYAHLCNSGSSANLLAILALTDEALGERRVLPGDEIITVAAGFPTTIAPILQCGAVPVFLDVTIPQYNIDCSKLEEAYSSRTKAVVLAHTLGNPFDLKAVKEFCDKHHLWLVEDNCDALGSMVTIDGESRPTGAWGDIATSSFYPPHHITLGEGGLVYTNHPLLSKAVLSFRDWGRECTCASGQDNMCGHRFDGQFGSLPSGYDHKYVYSHFGYNLKATDLQAAVGCAQLDKLEDFIGQRRENWSYLRKALAPLEGSLILPEPLAGSEPSWFGFLITVAEKNRFSRNMLTAHLEKKNIQTRLLFAGNVVRQPCCQGLVEGRDYRVVGELKNTDRVMNQSFWIGVAPLLGKAQLDYMVEQITEFVKMHS